MFFAWCVFAQTKNITCFIFVFVYFVFFMHGMCCAHGVKKCSCNGLQIGRQCSDFVMRCYI